MRISLKIALITGGLLMVLPRPAFAHPMGNFSINHYAHISANADGIRLRYVLDLAEIPTYQEMQRSGLVADAADLRAARYLAQQAASIRHGLWLRLNGE